MNAARYNRLPLFAVAAALLMWGCSGGSSAADSKTGGNFLVLETEPQDNGRLFLNEPIRIDFSNPVDLSTADLNTVSFTVLDQNGNPTSEQPVGTFGLARSPGDEQVGRRLEFIPAFPTNDTYDNGGFRPGRTYLMQLVGGDRINGTVLKDIAGKALSVPRTLTFSTADGTTPAQLFRDNVAGGPAFVKAELTPDLALLSSGGGQLLASTLNQMGQTDLEIRLTFNQPLNPHSQNVPVLLDTDPLKRGEVNKGRIFLEYDDSDPSFGKNRWIPADVELEVNSLDRSVITLRPVGVLPNNAEVRIIVESTMEDISGESNVANSAYDREVFTFRTDPSYAPQFDAIVEGFDNGQNIDFSAPFVEPLAVLKNGEIRSSFAFEGAPTILDYIPATKEVLLDTNFTTIQPANGAPFNVNGGIFSFRNVKINPGIHVQGLGTNPMVWLVSGDFEVGGTLSVSGGNGDRVNTLNSANFPAGGGLGVCGGGNGGRGSPNSLDRSLNGETGFGPGQVPGGGGKGGRLACSSCSRGSGGGGGSFATQGDPWFSSASFTAMLGTGAFGCLSKTLPGGAPGLRAFVDSRSDNNFFGVAVNAQRRIRITGELLVPIGGQGGGGGGDHAGPCTTGDPNFANDDKGGGGGGGGGALIIKCLGKITIKSSGLIIANGGSGGGGEQAGSSDQGGGGGGGAGGMVVLMAGQGIEINVKGETFANKDYDFSISADGGVMLTGTYRSPNITKKYPGNGVNTQTAGIFEARGFGGFGGMGVVQLMAPPGDNTDNTNTVLDDGVTIIKDGLTLLGLDKERYLAWRGFPDENGFLVDDFGNPVNIGRNEGDIRPAPVLMPAPFGPRTRMRSKWIDTGASVRRPVLFADGEPRGVIDPNGDIAGPGYRFEGTTINPTGIDNGFIDYQAQIGDERVDVVFDPILNVRGQIASIDPAFRHLGRPAYRVVLQTAPFEFVQGGPNRYAHLQGELFNNSGSKIAEYRILEHSDKVVILEADNLLPTGWKEFQVRDKLFRVMVNGVEGLGGQGETYRGFSLLPVPVANARIGFAFHKDPSKALATGIDPLRLPDVAGSFLYDLSDPLVQEQVRQFGAAFTMWDALFDVSFKKEPGDTPPGLSPNSPTISLDYLLIPFRF